MKNLSGRARYKPRLIESQSLFGCVNELFNVFLGDFSYTLVGLDPLMSLTSMQVEEY